MKNSKILGLMILLAFPAATLCAQDKSSKPRTENKVVPDKDKAGSRGVEEPTVKAATEDPNYIIGPEDELIVNVWREADLSRSVPVRPDGKISLPLLNDVQASGLTPMQLGSEITTRLKKFISEPQVTIIVSRVNSQRIYIVGEVNRAGAFPLVPNMTVLEALSSAGGCSPFAKQTKIYILRLENGQEIRRPFNFKEVLSGQRMEQNILLKAGDTIVVP
jgi:polysaccharide export outer membrane protein